MSTDGYFAALLEYSPDALVVFDQSSHIFSVNTRSEQLFGYARAELQSSSLSRLIPLGLSQLPAQVGTPNTLAVEARHKAGHTLPVEVTVIRIDAPERTLFSAAFRWRPKPEFIANISHELRSPLNVIIGFAKLMYRGRVGAVSDPHREYLGDILDSAEHLLALINDLVDLTKLETGRMDFHPEPVDLELLLHEVSESVDSLTVAKHATLELRVAPECVDVELDPDKLRQVLRRALSNALQLTAEGGSVQLHARLVKDAETDQIRFDIRGEHKLDAQATLRQADGGLGLTLAQRMVEQQGGRAGVSHELGQGSSYFVLLPRKPSINPNPSLGVT